MKTTGECEQSPGNRLHTKTLASLPQAHSGNEATKSCDVTHPFVVVVVVVVIVVVVVVLQTAGAHF